MIQDPHIFNQNKSQTTIHSTIHQESLNLSRINSKQQRLSRIIINKTDRDSNSIGQISKKQKIKLIQKLTIQYKLLNQICPRLGIYVLPNLNNYFIWQMIIFERQGYYKDARIKAKIFISQQKQSKINKIQFYLPVYHSLIHPQTGQLDLKTFKKLSGISNSQDQNLMKIIYNIKQLFIDRKFILYKKSFNPEPSKIYQKSEILFIEKVFQTTILPSLSNEILDNQDFTLLETQKEQTNESFLDQNSELNQISQITGRVKQLCFNTLEQGRENQQHKSHTNQELINSKVSSLLSYLLAQ